MALLDGYPSIVYCAEQRSNNVVIKIICDAYRTSKEMLSEIDFIHYLLSQGVATAQPIAATTGEFVVAHTIEGQEYLAYAFKFLEGQEIDCFSWNANTFYRAGVMMGDLHKHSENYIPKDHVQPRRTWSEAANLPSAIRFIPEEQNEILTSAQKLLACLNRLPKDKKSYGLLHGDMNTWNLIASRDSLSVIDFENSYYGWYADDIASAIYYTARDRWYWFSNDEYRAWAKSQGIGYDGNSFVEFSLHAFVAGYQSVHTISEFWVSMIPRFMYLRHLVEFLYECQENTRVGFDAQGRKVSIESYMEELKSGNVV